MIFVVHASFDAQGHLRGVVTHAQSGRKESFSEADRLGNLIAAMAGKPEESGTSPLDRLDSEAS